MSRITKGLAVLGSTGSVGTQTLDIVRAFPNDFNVIGLACNRNLDLLQSQIEEFAPRYINCNGTEAEMASLESNGCQDCDLDTMVRDPDVDMVVTATVGDVALGATLAAIDAGKDIALANKETVVMAGELVSTRAKNAGVPLLPLDSEPNAIWQCIRGEETGISRMIITASGGAFRKTPIGALADATPQQALKHPTWAMGQKITIDSATMMNKAFEVIEARWLFDVPWDDIEIVIHPESIIHSMVEFVDGSVKAQISPPDMHLPIQYAMFYPERLHNPNIKRFDPVATGALTFEPWEAERYPCFDMAIGYAKRGGSWPAALSGANDAAVELFLKGKIGFLEIGIVIKEALEAHTSNQTPDLDEIIAAGKDANARVVKIVEG
ncbi:MAG: 1-deoxy-D-xylulose-5-phosphate reductoisomerase [SAR202 cluster bacterium]|nr:1-deoxy-D-xylulose-5-phosphate reductoisomerase [SAR202 cluster bacterium]